MLRICVSKKHLIPIYRSSCIVRHNASYTSSFEDVAGARTTVANNKSGLGSISFSSGGFLGHLASGSAVCTHGGSVVHAAVSTAASDGPTDSFLPLTVDYRSRAYAFGLIPQNRIRRERHGSDEELLIGRIIDRAVRPLFPKGYVNQVQLTATAHAADNIHDPTIAAVNAASLSLLKADIGWKGPIGCVRMGLLEVEKGKGDVFVVNPTVEQLQHSKLDLVYAGTAERPLMMECVANEVPEAQMRQAMQIAQDSIAKIAAAQLDCLLSSRKLTTNNSSSGANIAAAPVKDHEAGATFEQVSLIDNAVEAATDEDVVMDVMDVRADQPRKPAVPADGIIRMPIGLQAAVDAFGLDNCRETFVAISGDPSLTRQQRGFKEGQMKASLLKFLSEAQNWPSLHPAVKTMAAEGTMKKAFREFVLGGVKRVDGRAQAEVRPVGANVDVLPVVHGSAFFRRGDTHVLCTTTLGTRADAKVQSPYALSGSASKEALTGERMNRPPPLNEKDPAPLSLHYDFPPYCTNVVGSASNVSRRMVGHGNLAERALRPVMPGAMAFPYTVRVFSECTSSSGSSSMASACGASLSLMDAGVPIKNPVAGVSVGLVTGRMMVPVAQGGALEFEGDAAAEALARGFVKSDPSDSEANSESAVAMEAMVEEEDFSQVALLTDLLGTEDYYGLMDFKIAGSKQGITAFQLDMKIDNSKGIPLEILGRALDAAKAGRETILQQMLATLSAPRPFLKDSAPRAEIITYDPERKMFLLGPGGEMLKYVQDSYGCIVDLSEEGVAYVYGDSDAAVRGASQLVQDIVALPVKGAKFNAEVTDVKDYGCTVKITRAQEALLHVSELTHDPKLLARPVAELVAVGQRIPVEVLSVDKGAGHVRVSRKSLLEKSGRDVLKATPPSLSAQAAPFELALSDLPIFPVNPPRKYSKDYFKDKVASEDAISEAIKAVESGNGLNNNNNNKSTGGKNGEKPKTDNASASHTGSKPVQKGGSGQSSGSGGHKVKTARVNTSTYSSSSSPNLSNSPNAGKSGVFYAGFQGKPAARSSSSNSGGGGNSGSSSNLVNASSNQRAQGEKKEGGWKQAQNKNKNNQEAKARHDKFERKKDGPRSGQKPSASPKAMPVPTQQDGGFFSSIMSFFGSNSADKNSKQNNSAQGASSASSARENSSTAKPFRSQNKRNPGKAERTERPEGKDTAGQGQGSSNKGPNPNHPRKSMLARRLGSQEGLDRKKDTDSDQGSYNRLRASLADIKAVKR